MKASSTILCLLLFLALSACPDADIGGGADPDEGNTSKLQGEGEPCSTGILCESELTCVNGICLDVQEVALVDAGEVIANNDVDGSVPSGGLADAGILFREDGGLSVVDSGVTPMVDAGPPPEPIRPWLLSVQNNTHQLLKVDIESGLWVALCTLNVNDTYNSTTFGFDGTLYGSNATDQTLDIIDPCTCEVTVIGPTNQGSIPGITANGDKIETLFGLSTSSDTLVTLDIATGAGTLVGSLGNGLNFINSGTTWATTINGLYSINSGDRKLYTLHTETGTASPISSLDIVVGAVGIEWHPATQELYLCSDPSYTSYLYEVNTGTGETTELGTLPYRCTNLAAPWTPVSCVDSVVVE